jgi:hypothetical protein
MNTTNMNRAEQTHMTRPIDCTTKGNDQKPSVQHLFNEIRHAIIGTTDHRFLIYEDVDREAGSLVVDLLDEDEVVENAAPR